MLLYSLLAYFLLISAGVVTFVLPRSPSRTWRKLGKQRDCGKTLPIQAYAPSRFLLIPRRACEIPLEFIKATMKYPVRNLGVTFFLTAPSLTLLSLNDSKIFEFDGTGRFIDPQVTALLEGERLTPPPPLPPAVFTTQEIEISRPDVVHASRNWQLLDSEFTQRLLIVFRLMEERHGYRMTLLEGYRSPERQAQLFDQGSHVTKARANMSYHQYGLAADSAFLKDGKIVISERDPWAMRGYELYGQVAEELGLTWGGRWQLRDFGHVELRRQSVLGQAAR